jgi:6-phosphogluconolactonase (cycloisomerase 2 family)
MAPAAVVCLSVFAASIGCSQGPGAEADGQATSAIASDRHDDVFTLSNDANANAVLAFERSEDGSLRPSGAYATGGKGTGAGLGSQGAIVLSDDGRFLYAVDAGSNEVSSFAVDGPALRFISRVASGGTTPVSLSARGRRLYVLNAGSSTVTALSIDPHGALSAPAASVGLSAPAAGGAQVSVSPRGDALVVTEKATSKLDVFPLDDDGLPRAGTAYASSGTTPFGFAFDAHDHVIVSEAFGAQSGASAVSSYALDRRDDALAVVSASIPDHQTAACWVVVTRDGRFAYTSNARSSSISAYALDERGALSLVGDGRTGITPDGTHPTDMTLDRASRRLYVLDAGDGIVAFDVGDDGSLTRSAAVSGLPPAVVGIAVR